MKKITTYVITVSEKFPNTHKMAGEETNFPNLIFSGRKKHTIRSNYDLWEKRFEKINKGEAILSLRVWTGKPYNSKQREFIRLDNTMGIGLQSLFFIPYLKSPNDGIISKSSLWLPYVETEIKIKKADLQELATNDGLSTDDFKEWFKNYDLSKPMAIIHFTNFRYS
jgi:hypothetical protein